MAYGDTSMWDPAESYFRAPSAYREFLRAKAAERADYLASMDQFYTQLEETKRQFNETLGYNVETRDVELGFKEKELAQNKLLSERELDLAEKTQEATEEYNKQLLNLQSRRISEEYGHGYGDVTEEEQFDYFKKEQKEQNKNTTDLLTRLLEGGESRDTTSMRSGSLDMSQNSEEDLWSYDEQKKKDEKDIYSSIGL